MISFLIYSYIVHDYAFWNPFSQYTIHYYTIWLIALIVLNYCESIKRQTVKDLDLVEVEPLFFLFCPLAVTLY